MNWTLFRQGNRSQAVWLATASNLALLASPAAARRAESSPVREAADEPVLTPDIAPRGDAPVPNRDDEVGFAADNLNYDSENESSRPRAMSR